MKVRKLSLIVLTSSLFLVGSVEAEIKDNVVSAMKNTCKYSLAAAKGAGAGACILSSFFEIRKLIKKLGKIYYGCAFYNHPEMRILQLTTCGIICSYVAYKLGKSFLRDFGILSRTSPRGKSEKVLS